MYNFPNNFRGILMNILDIDFNALYKEQKQITTFKPKTKADWNAKAKDMDSRIHQSIYNEEFLSRVDTKECSTLLDVGCGPGNLALRFASQIWRQSAHSQRNIFSISFYLKIIELAQFERLHSNCELLLNFG